jgi:hypothetical protein
MKIKHILLIIAIIAMLISLSTVSAATATYQKQVKTIKLQMYPFMVADNKAQWEEDNWGIASKYPELNITLARESYNTGTGQDHTLFLIFQSINFKHNITKVVLHLEDHKFGTPTTTVKSYTRTFYPVNYQKPKYSGFWITPTESEYFKVNVPGTGGPNDIFPDLRSIDIYYEELVPISISAAKPKIDLKTYVKKIGNKYYAIVKNNGKSASGKSKLGMYLGNKLVKVVNVPSLKYKKYKIFKFVINKKYAKYRKTFKADYNNKIKETTKKNNIFSIK